MTTDEVRPHPTLDRYYGEDAGREEYVRDIFDQTAHWYDATTRVLSLGSDLWYRRRALLRAGLEPGMRLLDLASGTGIVADAAWRSTRGDLTLVGADVSIGMLRQAAKKLPVSFINARGETLPFTDDHFDMVSIGFAMRHFSGLVECFSEIRRVLKPGGKILILELTPPESRIGRRLLGVYMNRIVPLIARIRSGDRRVSELMHYYWDTTASCIPPVEILDALERAGFSSVGRHVEAFVSSEYTATA